MPACGPTYSTLWRNKFLTTHVQTIGEMASVLEESAKTLREMEAEGVVLAFGQEDDYAHLTTTDPRVAELFQMEVDDDEMWEEEGEEG